MWFLKETVTQYLRDNSKRLNKTSNTAVLCSDVLA